MDIITKRSENMSFKQYRQHLKDQKNWIKRRGELTYLAVIHFKDATGREMKRTYPPAVKYQDGNGNVVYKPMNRLQV